MDAKRIGLQAFAGAAALLIAACSSNDPVDESAGAQAAVPAAPIDDSRAVRSGNVGEETVTSPFGEPTQASLESYAGDRVFYAFDSSELSPLARQTLQRQADWLKAHGRIRVAVEGHADERGTREYNLALGERRANAAKNYLVALGIAPDRLKTISYGKERPAVLGSGEEVWRQNRRAVLKVDQAGA